MTELIDFEELRQAARAVLAVECAGERVHRFIDGETALTNSLWRTMAELGWQGLAVPEAHGGLGLGSGDLMAIYYELGRHNAPVPLLGTQLVADALVTAGSAEQRERYLPLLAAGSWRAALSSPEWALAPAATLPQLSGGRQPVLSGRADYLLDGGDADLLLLLARRADGECCFVLVEPAADGVTLERVATVDATRHFAAVNLTGLQLPPERIVATGVETAALAEHLLDHAALALACDSIGGAERCFEQTVDYLKTRRQFNRLIGSFQALKHRCADLKVLLEASSGTVAKAVQAQRGAGAGAAWASMAKGYAGSAYARIAAEAMQLHGGIGFTWEHDCHLFLKRAKLNQNLFGSQRWHQDRVARALVAAG